MQVIKNSGITQDFDPAKIERVIEWAREGTSVSTHELLSLVLDSLSDNMKTSDIQKVVIKTAADLISVEEPDYQLVAGRLAMFGLRKDVYGQYDPIPFIDLIRQNVAIGVYDPEILEKWTEEEINELEKHLDHENDMTYEYAGVIQFREKYMVQNRSIGKIYETPQYAYMLIGMCLHQEEEKKVQHAKDFYDQVAGKIISLPTPIMAGVRTPTRQFSSCVKIEVGDSLESINESAAAVVNYISKRAGIGINAGRIRAEGSQVRSGEVKHTGVIPFWKHFQTAVKSCSQGGVRGGAATLYYPMWHLEFEKLIVLKNNKGVDENRIRQLDYGLQINKLMFERLVADDYVTLFSPDVAAGRLYDYFFEDEAKFKELYETLEKDPTIRKKRIKARDIFTTAMMERANTGRVYIQFVTNVNENSPFDEPIKMSNLCVEICLPTYPITKNIEESEIALCTLSAFNLGKIESLHDFEKAARVAVRALDNLLDYQEYPMEAALKGLKRRSLGIGITNFAYYLAKNYVKYSDGSANELVHEMMEAFQYYLLKASMELAKERGACEYFHKTSYSRGVLPIDRYKKTVDNLVDPVYRMDWEALRADIMKYGLRNSTLSALMPCESSSQITNSTNGIEPPRQLLSVKQSKDGVLNQLVPEVEILASEYELAWQMADKGMKGYLSLVAIMQKFCDQSISANTYSNPYIYPGDKVPMEVMLADLIFMQVHGIKTIYYHNTRDGADGSESVVEEAADCETCKV
ncbi:NrdA-like aerobic NDP reductase large subunit [Cronobacter phage S13]|jgi:ribonucleoside-diphosphate reductase alpha chain|uniref:Ribonucleoside-diphosphate reductase n=1 Tax=Cronobacter phage LPCS28 TaxID=2924885 RepID=A0AAE9G8N4_9CAUD|nr:NrdA-like aerobic NDP reductase large subunit [Cronobacter phage S13]YP_010665869.1 ribonucleotide reductase [Cronobacter phage LPCS28]AIA64817.1 putative aerobic NDP reductase large subunit [Cronobacter phage S13]UNY47058.1 ribonucleoside-diphosphate reductase 1 subunit alpha [Cronobacter phage LPCS28]